jgi:hypothetical protein
MTNLNSPHFLLDLQNAQLATSGNISATGNGSIAVSNHGPGSGIKSLYWVTVSRVYRSDVTQITEGSSGTQILSYSMDGNNYDFEQTINYIASGETSHVFVT